jgi:hypothetical protein
MNPVVSSNYKPQRPHIRFGQDADPPKQKLGQLDKIMDPQPPEKVVYFDEILKTDDPHLNAMLQCGMEGRSTQGKKTAPSTDPSRSESFPAMGSKAKNNRPKSPEIAPGCP